MSSHDMKWLQRSQMGWGYLRRAISLLLPAVLHFTDRRVNDVGHDREMLCKQAYLFLHGKLHGDNPVQELPCLNDAHLGLDALPLCLLGLTGLAIGLPPGSAVALRGLRACAALRGLLGALSGFAWGLRATREGLGLFGGFLGSVGEGLDDPKVLVVPPSARHRQEFYLDLKLMPVFDGSDVVVDDGSDLLFEDPQVFGPLAPLAVGQHRDDGELPCLPCLGGRGLAVYADVLGSPFCGCHLASNLSISTRTR